MIKSFVYLFTLFFALSLPVFAQTPTPTPEPTPIPAPPKKINPRPTPDPNAPPEPFDGASVEKMREQCDRPETEAGNIEIELFPESAPETVRNFLNLIALGIFDTTTFSRIVPRFVIQGGSVGTRSPLRPEFFSRARRVIPDEPSLIKHERGILSMARGDEPGTATSHFFILVSDAPHLDNKFAAFGKVLNGMDVVDTINKAEVVEETPTKPTRISKAVVTGCPKPVETLDGGLN